MSGSRFDVRRIAVGDDPGYRSCKMSEFGHTLSSIRCHDPCLWMRHGGLLAETSPLGHYEEEHLLQQWTGPEDEMNER